MSRLKATSEGQSWLKELEGAAFVEPRPEAYYERDPAKEEALAERIVRTCLRRLSPEVPVYQVVAEKAAALEPPRPPG